MVTKIWRTSEMSRGFFRVRFEVHVVYIHHMILDTLEEGQIWRNQQVGALGIIKRVRETDPTLDRAVVDLISLTGNHLTTTLSKMGLWTFHEESATTYQPCRFSSCKTEAGYQYTRERLADEPSIEAVCYHHIPRGVRSDKMTAPIEQSLSFMGICAQCGEIGNEIIGELNLDVVKFTSMWFCFTCNQNWIVSNITDVSLTACKRKYQPLRVVPNGYEVKHLSSFRNAVEASTTFVIKIEPHLNTRLQGQKAATMYDLIRLDDD